MLRTYSDVDHRAELFVHEVLSDAELCRAFLEWPDNTLRAAADWGLPFSDSEVGELEGLVGRLWEHVVEELEARPRAA